MQLLERDANEMLRNADGKRPGQLVPVHRVHRVRKPRTNSSASACFSRCCPSPKAL